LSGEAKVERGRPRSRGKAKVKRGRPRSRGKAMKAIMKIKLSMGCRERTQAQTGVSPQGEATPGRLS